VQNKEPVVIYTEDQLMARLRFFIGICLALTLTGIVFVVLYSLIFVTQPLNAISPMDQKFFELIIPIATFLTGTLSGIMLAGKKPEDVTPPKPSVASPLSPPPLVPKPVSGGVNFETSSSNPAPVATAAPAVPRVAVPIIKKPGE
jgi:hypothetical protein